jgi:glutamine---fructose-6-phosphate transaminase (isomerizing)
MLSVALQDNASRRQMLVYIPGWVEQMLAKSAEIAQLAQRYRFMERCVVIGRGYNYSTAFEWSLKMKELAYVLAEPYSSADFMHGPLALIERGFPVLAVAPSGKVFESVLELLEPLRKDYAAELVVISDEQAALNLAQSPIALPGGIPEWLSPVVSIVPGQLFSYALTVEKGLNTEAPRSIQKVTETQ